MFVRPASVRGPVQRSGTDAAFGRTAQLGRAKRIRRTKAQLAVALQRLVKEKNGRCLTPDFETRETALTFECSEGHRWETQLGNILDGSWCPVCGEKKKVQAVRDRWGTVPLDDVDEVALWAESRGLTFIESPTPCTGRYDFFRCATGHLWEIPRLYSAPGSWCPVCGTCGEPLGVGRVVR